MKTASFHTTARKAILATLQTNRDDLRVHDTREWRFLTDEEFRRLGHAKPSDVSYAGDLDDYGMFDGTWRAAVDCGDALPHASEYSISGMLIAFDDKTVWETVCAGLDLLGKERKGTITNANETCEDSIHGPYEPAGVADHCGGCGIPLCEEHARKCPCCGRVNCTNCGEICEACWRLVCREHAKWNPEYAQYECPACYDRWDCGER